MSGVEAMRAVRLSQPIRFGLVALAVMLATTGASWSDPHAVAREAARKYADGDFAAAAEKYNQALVDAPDSALLHFNLGASEYRRGDFEQAIAAFARVADGGEDSASIAYNVANALVRLGDAAEGDDAEKALEHYVAAMAAYRRAMAADPGDVDAKHNHEVVERKIDELRKRQEEEQNQEDQQQDQDQNQEQDQNQQDRQQRDPRQDEHSESEEQRDDQIPDEQEEPESAGASDDSQEPAEQNEPPEESPKPRSGDEARTEDAGEPGTAREAGEGEMTEREAQALLDQARDQEVHPAEIIRRQQGAAVLEPEQDW